MVKPWQTERSEQMGDYRIFQIRQDLSRSPRTGLQHTFYVLESLDWTNVIALTPAGKVVLIRQFRHGTGRVEVEIPGGIVDADDASPMASAQRELLEETGYVAEKLVLLGSVAPNPAFLNNQCHTYLALGARQVQAPRLDGSEDIAVEEADLADIPVLIASGQIAHAMVVAAFYHFGQYRRQHPELCD